MGGSLGGALNGVTDLGGSLGGAVGAVTDVTGSIGADAAAAAGGTVDGGGTVGGGGVADLGGSLGGAVSGVSDLTSSLTGALNPWSSIDATDAFGSGSTSGLSADTEHSLFAEDSVAAPVDHIDPVAVVDHLHP